MSLSETSSVMVLDAESTAVGTQGHSQLRTRSRQSETDSSGREVDRAKSRVRRKTGPRVRSIKDHRSSTALVTTLSTSSHRLRVWGILSSLTYLPSTSRLGSFRHRLRVGAPLKAYTSAPPARFSRSMVKAVCYPNWFHERSEHLRKQKANRLFCGIKAICPVPRQISLTPCPKSTQPPRTIDPPLSCSAIPSSPSTAAASNTTLTSTLTSLLRSP
jgi:hypothetical protein